MPFSSGVFLCIRCSGIHRGMGTHISRVKSVDLDIWTPEQIEVRSIRCIQCHSDFSRQSIQLWGNKRANLYWEAHLKSGHIPPEQWVNQPRLSSKFSKRHSSSKIESFIRSKYESRRWAKEGPPPPDPSVLEGGLPADAPPPPPSQEQPVVAPARKSFPLRSSEPSPRASRFTTQQPQAHQLLSTNFSKPTPAQVPSRPVVQPPSDPAPSLQDDLFSLDFHAPPPVIPSNVAPEQPKKDVKQDILSLFLNTVPAHNPGSSSWNVPSERQQPTQITSMIGSTGAGAWGASSGWSAPAPTIPAQPNVWNSSANSTTQQNNNLLNTSNVWGGTPTTTSNTAYAAQKDDVFSDIWGSFK